MVNFAISARAPPAAHKMYRQITERVEISIASGLLREDSKMPF